MTKTNTPAELSQITEPTVIAHARGINRRDVMGPELAYRLVWVPPLAEVVSSDALGTVGIQRRGALIVEHDLPNALGERHYRPEGAAWKDVDPVYGLILDLCRQRAAALGSLFVVRREATNRYLGAHPSGWVRSVDEAAVFLSEGAARRAADLVREDNTGVVVVEYVCARAKGA